MRPGWYIIPAVIIGACLWIMLTLLVFAIIPSKANAHEWYDAACCSDRDCAPVDPSAVKAVEGGFLVVVEPGTHPMLAEGQERIERFVEHGNPRLRQSQDNNYHVCLNPWRHVLCVYIPPLGA